MDNLTDTINNITIQLEDAILEQEWDMVKEVVDELNGLYEQLDRQSTNYLDDY